jgi:hypothetical protein
MLSTAMNKGLIYLYYFVHRTTNVHIDKYNQPTRITCLSDVHILFIKNRCP